MSRPEKKRRNPGRAQIRGGARGRGGVADPAWWLGAAYGICFLVLSGFLVADRIGAGKSADLPGASSPAEDVRFGREETVRSLVGRTFAAVGGSAWMALISCAVGTALGMASICGIARVSVVSGGNRLLRWTGAVLRLPSLFLLLVFSAGFGAGFWKTTLAMTLLTAVFALSHGSQWLTGWQSRGDVLAARALGAGRARLVREHLLPCLMPRMVALAAVLLPSVLVAESALGFAGFGIGEGIPNAGRLIFEGWETMFEAPWRLVFPGLALWGQAAVFGLLAAAAQRLTGQTVSDRLM